MCDTDMWTHRNQTCDFVADVRRKLGLVRVGREHVLITITRAESQQTEGYLGAGRLASCTGRVLVVPLKRRKQIVNADLQSVPAIRFIRTTLGGGLGRP